MRVGYSFQSMFSSKTTVENNLFDQCDGEIEIISSKSCDNIYRNNTFNNCAGFLTLRHGNRCTVDANFFLGQNKKGSGGVRIIGEDHTITNNYFADLTDGVFRITSSIPDSELKGYFQAKRCTIAFNTIVNCKGAYLELDAGINTSRRTLRPENITIANNLFLLPPDGAQLIKGQEGEGWKWMGNIAWLEVGHEFKGIRMIYPKLESLPPLRKYGYLRPAEDSPARESAEGDFPQVKTDIFGQARAGRFVVGCDQCTPAFNHPASPKDVGPSWSVDIRSQPPDNPAEEKK
jgi:poly(beta-D-mannuronate) lyase